MIVLSFPEATVVRNGDCLSPVWPGVLMGFQSLHVMVHLTESKNVVSMVEFYDGLTHSDTV